MKEGYDRSDQDAGDIFNADRKSQLIELCVFLFLIFPSMVLFFFVRHQEFAGLDITVIATAVHDLAFVSLIAFFLWRNGEPLKMLGWSKGEFQTEVWIGIALFGAVFLGASLLDRFLAAAGLSSTHGSLPSFLAARSPAQYVAISLMIMVVAFAEETIFRGYLMLRIKNITGSDLVSVVLSSVIFSLGHGYEGMAGVITVFFIGTVLAAVYLRRKSLVAPIVIHFLQDFVGIVLLPLLK